MIYGIENATQRGTDSTAVVGTVAGAVRIIAKALLVGDLSRFQERLSQPRGPITGAEFLARAWKLANNKARELGLHVGVPRC